MSRSGPAGPATPFRIAAAASSRPCGAAPPDRRAEPDLRAGPAWQAERVPSLFDDLSWRGLIHQLTDHEILPRRLDCDRLVLYIGFDPTANSLHVGHLQQICLLRRCQG